MCCRLTRLSMGNYYSYVHIRKLPPMKVTKDSIISVLEIIDDLHGSDSDTASKRRFQRQPGESRMIRKMKDRPVLPQKSTLSIM